MYEHVEKKSDKAGLPPGSLIYVGDAGSSESIIQCRAVTADGIEEFTLDEFSSLLEKSEVSIIWVDVRGINSVANTGRVMDLFDLHVLTREDILDTSTRPKVEMDEGYVFVVCKRFNRQPGGIEHEQMALVMKGKCVLTIQETVKDSFAAIAQRLPVMKEKNRSSAYLFYALLDTLVDSYYTFIESFGDEIEEMDEKLLETSDPDIFRNIRVLKNELLIFRRNLWAMREVLHRLLNEGDSHFPHKVTPYLRDVYDNILQMWETVDMYRDMVGSAIEIYLSSASNRLNEVMKVLTIISTIFIPITFIAGLYGMNFADMPELGWRYGYPATLAVMLVCVLVMLRYFKNKKWL